MKENSKTRNNNSPSREFHPRAIPPGFSTLTNKLRSRTIESLIVLHFFHFQTFLSKQRAIFGPPSMLVADDLEAPAYPRSTRNRKEESKRERERERQFRKKRLTIPDGSVAGVVGETAKAWRSIICGSRATGVEPASV